MMALMDTVAKKILPLTIPFVVLYAVIIFGWMRGTLSGTAALLLGFGVFIAEGVTVIPILLKTHKEADDVRFVCDGSCGAQITQAQYDGGLHVCGAPGCSHEGQPFRRLDEGATESK